METKTPFCFAAMRRLPTSIVTTAVPLMTVREMLSNALGIIFSKGEIKFPRGVVDDDARDLPCKLHGLVDGSLDVRRAAHVHDNVKGFAFGLGIDLENLFRR